MSKIQEYAEFNAGVSKTIKLFNYAMLPNDLIAKTAYDLMGEAGRDYGAYPYIIYGSEVDYEDYSPTEKAEAIENDEWFISQGCTRGETIILIDNTKFNNIK